MRNLVLVVLFANIFASSAVFSFLDQSDDSTNDDPGLTREELGQHGWALLHSIASFYPTDPSEEHLNKTYEWLYSFAELYPC